MARALSERRMGELLIAAELADGGRPPKPVTREDGFYQHC